MLKRRQLGKTSLRVSEIGLGCWQLGGELIINGVSTTYGNVTKENTKAIIECALDSGVNTFDTADVYSLGQSERRLGEILKERRNDVYIFSKAGNVMTYTETTLSEHDFSDSYLISVRMINKSSGGVDKGYRHYVESLANVAEPPAEVKGLLQQKFQSANPDIEAWTRLAAMSLSEVVHNLVIVSPPRLPQTRLRHVELVYLQEFVVLLVLVLQETKLRQQLVYLETPILHGDAVQVANKLNYHFAGLTGEEIRNSNDDLSPVEGEITEAALRLLGTVDKEAYIEYHSDGLRHILGQPELMGASRAYALAAILENGPLVRTLLGATPRNGVRVIIGEENLENVLQLKIQK